MVLQKCRALAALCDSAACLPAWRLPAEYDEAAEERSIVLALDGESELQPPRAHVRCPPDCRHRPRHRLPPAPRHSRRLPLSLPLLQRTRWATRCGT